MLSKKWSKISSTVLIMGMFALADFWGEKEIIFPEISALALGFWVMDKSPWQGHLLSIWVSPTLAALTGVLLQRYIALPPLVLIGCALILVVIYLRLLNSEVFPSISAAILAIITHTTSLLYPLSVGILMAIIVLGKSCRKNINFPQKDKEPLQNRQEKLVYWNKILVIVLAVAALALSTNCLFIIAPPLIVAFIELSQPKQPLRQASFKTILLLLSAASSGVLLFYLTVILLYAPLWLFGGLSLTSVFLLFHFFKISFPPVAAIALLPVFVPADVLWFYPLHVLVGSGLFVMSDIVFFNEIESRV